ncbi:hypothetical protein ST47_g7903 [Ascochyta rabiei]|uniref:Uncharacterized protein n=1 Tax=Didymella rabiei TaxID=5454 RepID=A0A163A2V2_DIDRA|nr:hypothetical protein ST47_g7903 [Ascochyta rabiei]
MGGPDHKQLITRSQGFDAVSYSFDMITPHALREMPFEEEVEVTAPLIIWKKKETQSVQFYQRTAARAQFVPAKLYSRFTLQED